MKKILIFSLAYFPKPVGGAEIAIKEITDRISSAEFEFHMVTLRFYGDFPKSEQIGNVAVHRVGFGGGYVSKMLFIPLAAAKALSLHKTERFDGAWAMMSYMLFPLILMRLFGVKLPYLLTLQEGDTFAHMFERPHVALFRPLISAGFRNAAAVQAISTYLGAWAKHLGFRRPVDVIPNGVDTAYFSELPLQSDVTELQDKLGKKMGDVYLITTSRLVHKNAVDDLISALAYLPDNVHALVLGVGPEEEKLKALAKEKNVMKRVRFLGYVPHEKLPIYLKACDIFVRASRSEGMGNSFIEAFAAGIPVVATQEGGLKDFLFDEKRNPDTPVTGWAVEKDSPEDIARAVSDIMSHREKVGAVVRTARALAVGEYDWSMLADRMHALFKRIFV